MRRRSTTVAALAAALTMLAAGAARATEPTDLESAKHLTMLELYLRGARDSAKALEVVAVMGQTPSDATLLDEVAHCAIDQVGLAEVHLRQLKKMGARSAPIEVHLRKARQAVNQLSAFKPRDQQLRAGEIANLKIAAEHINAHVSDALRAVETLAVNLNHSTLEDVELRERIPVKGRR
jgi:hypothetical protein